MVQGRQPVLFLVCWAGWIPIWNSPKPCACVLHESLLSRYCLHSSKPIFHCGGWRKSIIHSFRVCNIRVTSHQSLRACDHWNFKSLIGGKCQDHPSLLELEGIRDQWSMHWWTNPHEFLHGMKWIMFHRLSDFAKTNSKDRPNTKAGDYDTSKSHKP